MIGKGMKIKRVEAHAINNHKWCGKCGKITNMTSYPGLPAIFLQKCSLCNSHFQSNYNEDYDQIIDIPDWFILPSKSILKKWVYEEYR
jgi:hypothetical protein